MSSKNLPFTSFYSTVVNTISTDFTVFTVKKHIHRTLVEWLFYTCSCVISEPLWVILKSPRHIYFGI